MLRRAWLGLLKGGLVGALVAVALVKGLGLTVFGGLWLAIPAVVVAGVLVGLVAGRPIWSQGAQVEAGLKAAAGALLGIGLLFLVRRFLPFEVALPAALGQGPIGELPVLTLPLVAMVLGLLFDLDNTGERQASVASRRRIVADGHSGRARVGEQAADADADAEDAADAAPRRQRH